MTLLFALFSLLPALAADLDPSRVAPALRMHPAEKYRPADPVDFFRAAAPAMDAKEFPLPSLAASHAPAPWLWQNSGSRILELLPAGSRWDLIDYWYFTPYNEAGLWFSLGDHEGDWEGIAILFRESSPVAAYYSQHDGGQWYCARDLERDDQGRIVVYSSLGSHASFPRPGIYPRGLFFLGSDEAALGQTVPMRVRALQAEPYYKFEGRWGKESWRPRSKGPISPHGERKFLPRSFEVKDADWIKNNCL